MAQSRILYWSFTSPFFSRPVDLTSLAVRVWVACKLPLLLFLNLLRVLVFFKYLHRNVYLYTLYLSAEFREIHKYL